MTTFEDDLLAFLLELRGSETKEWYDRIRASYSEPQRHYHTLSHLDAMWSHLEAIAIQESGSAVNPTDLQLLKLAIIFHDIVYDPTKKDNEEKSVLVFADFANDVGLPSTLIQDVTSLILATIYHRIPDGNYPSCLPFFLDLDLEVLSRPRDKYTLYAQQIREEYRHFSDDAYRRGRIAVLRKLGSGDIYFTDACRSRWKQLALENLQWEVDSLENADGGEN